MDVTLPACARFAGYGREPFGILIMQQAATTEDTVQAIPSAWSLYFTEEEYSAEDRRAILLRDLLPRLATRASWLACNLLPHQMTGRHGLVIAWEELQKVCDSSELSAALEMQPAEALACVGAAAHQESHSDQLPTGS